MQVIDSSRKKFADIISVIDGIAVQTHEAIGNLDQMTQQNAALVEESAAAAESLREQAHNMKQAVAVFRVPEHQYDNALVIR